MPPPLERFQVIRAGQPFEAQPDPEVIWPALYQASPACLPFLSFMPQGLNSRVTTENFHKTATFRQSVSDSRPVAKRLPLVNLD
jgi:hypothetical protein